MRFSTGTTTAPVEELMTTSPTSARIASVIARKSSTSYDGVPSGVRAWTWIIDAPSSTARRASAAYSSGVYGIAGHWSRLATAPEIEQVRITGSSRLMTARYLDRRAVGLLTGMTLTQETRHGFAMTVSALTAVVVTDAERRLNAVLRITAGVLLALAVAAAIGTIAAALREPPW